MLTDSEYRAYLDQPKHTINKLKQIASKIVGTVKTSLAGKTRAEIIDHLIKYTMLDESMNIHLRHEVSLINATKVRKPRSDKGVSRGATKAKKAGDMLMETVKEINEKPKSKVNAGKVLDIKTKSGKVKRVTMPIE